MKFDCGSRAAAKKKWHRWFAWYPVMISARDCRWLETVERKGEHHTTFMDDWWSFSYRPVD